jgi:hypothetical protein
MVRPGDQLPCSDTGPADVTQWGSLFVSQVAARAGFRGEAMHDATALAMAATQGQDHYAHNPISLPGAERRGLWAIRVDEVPVGAVGDLFDPEFNAKVARLLWQASSDSFGWHPSWISGAALQIRPAIKLHIVGGGKRRGPLSMASFSTQVHGMVARAEAFARNLEPGRVPNE